ncbi:MAG: hypothetical protein J6X54_02400 [Treponema sp.]|nr:hypothetical protein [Treponema sp.]
MLSNKNKEVLAKRNLSLKAKGLYVLLLLLKDQGEIIDFKNVSSLVSDGRDSITTAINELKKKGILSIERLRDDYGRFYESEWLF